MPPVLIYSNQYIASFILYSQMENSHLVPNTWKLSVRQHFTEGKQFQLIGVWYKGQDTRTRALLAFYLQP